MFYNKQIYQDKGQNSTVFMGFYEKQLPIVV